MKVTKRLFVIFTVAAIGFLMGDACQGPQAILSATARDTIFSVEKRANGAYVMWLTHDDVGTYCTGDSKMGDLATEIMKSGHDALVTYKTLNVDSKENGAFGGLLQGQCNTDRGSGNNTNYVVTDLQYATPLTGTLSVKP